MRLYLIFCFLASLALHALTLPVVAEALMVSKTEKNPAKPFLTATLQKPEKIEEVDKTPKPADDLLKNTLEETLAKDAPKPQNNTKNTVSLSQKAEQKFRKQLSDYVFYPAIAKENNWQGVVQLFVTVDQNGRVENVEITQSSGYSVLDNAAIKGFYAVGNVPGQSAIWTYEFRLEE